MGQSSRRRAFVTATKNWILAHPAASLAETEQHTGAKRATVQKIRKELHMAGILPRYPNTPQPRTDTPTSPISTSQLLEATEDVEGILSGEAAMPRERRMAKLNALVEHGAPDHIIRANNEIEKMLAKDRTGEEIGPPPPQTLDDAVDQVSDMIEALMAWGGEPSVRTAVVRGMERHSQNQKFVAALPTITVQPDLVGSKEN